MTVRCIVSPLIERLHAQALVATTMAFGVANRVLYKMALVPLGDYVFFLAQFQTFGYIFAILILLGNRNVSLRPLLTLTNIKTHLNALQMPYCHISYTFNECRYVVVYFSALFFRYRCAADLLVTGFLNCHHHALMNKRQLEFVKTLHTIFTGWHTSLLWGSAEMRRADRDCACMLLKKGPCSNSRPQLLNRAKC